MTPCKVGDIVAVEFPFSDLQGQKRRPGLVLDADENDVLLARLTTHPPRNASDVSLSRWNEVGLPKPSTVRLTKLATVDRRLVHHTIGHLRPEDAATLGQAVAQLTDKIIAELRK
jgi:mRNA interferase MazF